MLCHHHAAQRCRSCTWLPRPYAQQLADKQAHCRALLAAFPQIEWLQPVGSAETGFRNKAKMVVLGSAAQPLLGIVDPRGAALDLADCPLYPAALQRAFEPVRAFIRSARIEPYSIGQRRGELKYVLLTLAEHSGELMLRLVLRSREALDRIRAALPALQAALPGLRVVSANLQPEHKAVLEGEVEIPLGGSQSLTMRLNGLPLHLRPQSFFQTNSNVAAALYRLARDWVDELDPASVWDLYCGVGGFALHVADGRRAVLGLELSVEAVASARRSAAESNLEQVEFRQADATGIEFPPDRPQLVIVNPPRRGLGPQLCAALQAGAVQALLYSSCNAETLARDLAALPGFVPERACVLDMFPHTAHYEVLVLARRGSGAHPPA